ncbi:hypothetical protein KAREA_02650 [Prescottella equi]|nr:hypothetical protein KAREA_02650 [Prescottella equi]
MPAGQSRKLWYTRAAPRRVEKYGRNFLTLLHPGMPIEIRYALTMPSEVPIRIGDNAPSLQGLSSWTNPNGNAGRPHLRCAGEGVHG